MKKFKIGPSFFLLIVFSIICGHAMIIVNYMLALCLHELAHLWVAVRRGYSLKLIKLDIFGLSVELNEFIDDRDSFKINLAGPVFNLCLSIICMALYWAFPMSYFYLNTFCFCNIMLAIFNLIPVYPLDGGKLFRGMINDNKLYKRFDFIIRCSFAMLFIFAFVCSCLNKPNIFMLIIALFFITSKGKSVPTMSIFKHNRNKDFDKVVILKVKETETLFNLIKQIKSHHYTIFYVPKLNKYFDEDEVVELALNNHLTLQINAIK